MKNFLPFLMTILVGPTAFSSGEGTERKIFCSLYAPGFKLKQISISPTKLDTSKVRFQGIDYSFSIFKSCSDDGGNCGPKNLSVTIESTALKIHASSDRRDVFGLSNEHGNGEILKLTAWESAANSKKSAGVFCSFEPPK